MDSVVFPEGAFGSVFSGVGTQLADDGALRGFFLSQRHEDAAALVPFRDDSIFPNFSDGLQDSIAVTARMTESGERGADFIMEILVTRGEPVAGHVEKREIHLI